MAFKFPHLVTLSPCQANERRERRERRGTEGPCKSLACAHCSSSSPFLSFSSLERKLRSDEGCLFTAVVVVVVVVVVVAHACLGLTAGA